MKKTSKKNIKVMGDQGLELHKTHQKRKGGGEKNLY